MTDADSGSASARLHPLLVEVVACPACHGPLSLDAEHLGAEHLDCGACRLAYPVRDGVPVLLVDEAVPLDSGASGSSGEQPS